MIIILFASGLGFVFGALSFYLGLRSGLSITKGLVEKEEIVIPTVTFPKKQKKAYVHAEPKKELSPEEELERLLDEH